MMGRVNFLLPSLLCFHMPAPVSHVIRSNDTFIFSYIHIIIVHGQARTAGGFACPDLGAIINRKACHAPLVSDRADESIVNYRRAGDIRHSFQFSHTTRLRNRHFPTHMLPLNKLIATNLPPGKPANTAPCARVIPAVLRTVNAGVAP
jgi:hypothetical protein